MQGFTGHSIHLPQVNLCHRNGIRSCWCNPPWLRDVSRILHFGCSLSLLDTSTGRVIHAHLALGASQVHEV
eukprot:1246980-Amphidinium_carterae.1